MSLEERDNELDKKMAEHPAEKAIKVLIKDANRRRLQVRVLAVSVIFDIILTASFGFVAIKTNELARLAQSNKQAVIANCETSNDSRRNNRTLWDYAFTLTPVQPLTAGQEAQRAQFKNFVAKTFAERDCQAEINQK